MLKLVKHVPWLFASFSIAVFGLSLCSLLAPSHANEYLGKNCTSSTWPACGSNLGCSGVGDEQCGSGTGTAASTCVC